MPADTIPDLRERVAAAIYDHTVLERARRSLPGLVLPSPDDRPTREGELKQ
jgi:hypothetical protein